MGLCTRHERDEIGCVERLTKVAGPAGLESVATEVIELRVDGVDGCVLDLCGVCGTATSGAGGAADI